MKNFLSCDWGSSRLRLRSVDIDRLKSESIEANDKGIAAVFESWKRSGVGESGRFVFYLDVINERVRMLEQQSGKSFDKATLVISGMASSSIGMLELDYKRIPCSYSGADLEIKKIAATKDIPRDIIIISGIRSEDDAMRGEETQLAGCDHDLSETRTFIFPGTHSKHVLVKQGRIADIKTYMSGEFFDLLATMSVLSLSVKGGEGLENKKNKSAFESGIGESRQSNLLHNSFLVRTNQLFNKLSQEENYYFLSGLIIGTELTQLITGEKKELTLVASGAMKELYIAALNGLGLQEGKSGFLVEEADSALIKGQLKILKNNQLQQ